MIDKFRKNKIHRELEQLKKKVVVSIDENININQLSIDNFCCILENSKDSKFSRHDSFFNLCIYSDLTSIDLIILLEKISLAKRVQEKKLYARILATIIIDYLDNINVLLGHDCQLELKTNNMTEFQEEFKSIHKKFSNFKKENDRFLRDIRNNTIAHKTKNAIKLNNLINGINVDEIYDFAIELKGYSSEFVNLSTKVINYIVDYMTEDK